ASVRPRSELKTKFSPTFLKMPNAVILTYCVVFWVEATLICIGNAFTIFVFWNERRSLKRACYLLLNLAVADFLVGATKLVNTTTDFIHQKFVFYGDVPSIFVAMFSSVSLSSLLVISLERACAVVWPFRHRVVGTCVYVMSIIMVWAAGLCVATVNGLTAFYIVNDVHSNIFNSIMFFISLCLISVTYMAIRTRMRCTKSTCAVKPHNRKLIEQNIKLSKTMFIVIGLSFGFWLPAIMMYTILLICDGCFTGTLYVHAFSLGAVLCLANSLVNPIVYSYRMPMFKKAMKKLLRKIAE
ncbi:hypothetical protein ACROYT_G024052, partial [Oculina patagonica]